jgi:TatD DNase family protein
MHLVDSHCHLDNPRFAEDLDAVLARSYAAGVRTILTIGIGEGPAYMGNGLALARLATASTPAVYASAGIYPGDAHEATEADYARLEHLVQDPNCIAVGEIGLDYYHAESPAPEIQAACFARQMQIAVAARKPILIHCRPNDGTPNFPGLDVWNDLFALIEEHWTPHDITGVMHCFSGTQAHADRSLANNFVLSFAGHTTFPKSKDLMAVAVSTPLDRILVETDAPYLAPIPHRGQRNEPAYTAYTAAAIAAARGLTPQDFAQATTANFRRIFGVS